MLYVKKQLDVRRLGCVFENDPFAEDEKDAFADETHSPDSDINIGNRNSKISENLCQNPVNSKFDSVAKNINGGEALTIQKNDETYNLVEELDFINSSLNEISGEVESQVEEPIMKNEFGNSHRKFSVNSNENNINMKSEFEADKNKNGDEAEISKNMITSKRSVIQHNTGQKSRILEAYRPDFDIVVAIDIGTFYSGFAYSYIDAAEENIYFIKNKLGNKMKKVPSILLLNSRMEFHSFGFEAKDNYMNIETNLPSATSQWLFFDKFKFQLNNINEIDTECLTKATNGKSIPLMTIFSRTLNYFKWRVLQDISKDLEMPIKRDSVRWILTIPAIWSCKGKLFMQEAAYNAGLCAPNMYRRLTIINESDAALEWCIKTNPVQLHSNSNSVTYIIVMNCGGGIVDFSIYEAKCQQKYTLINIHKTYPAIYGGIGVNDEFISLLNLIFGEQIMAELKKEHPVLFLDLVSQFEASACYCLNNDNNSSTSPRTVEININQTFLELYEKRTRKQVKDAITELGHQDVLWYEIAKTIVINYNIVKQFFQPIINKINKQINLILRNYVDENSESCLYVIGGLIRSKILQEGIWEKFAHRINVIFPEHDVELYTLKGAISKGFDAQINKLYRVPHSYAVGVLKPFEDNIHPSEKMFIQSGKRWCSDLLDMIVMKNQLLQTGEVFLRRYTPSNNQQSQTILNIYSVEYENSKYITDIGVHSCGILHLATLPSTSVEPREMWLQIIFDGKDFTASILDTYSGRSTHIQLDSITYL